MADQNFPFMNQGGQPQNNSPVGGQVPQGGSLGTGEGEAPLAQTPSAGSGQAPKFDMRTMASDISSMKSGEEQPKPYEPQMPAPNIPPMGGGGMPPMDMATMPADEIKKEEAFILPQVGDMTGKEEPIAPPASPQETKMEAAPMKETETKSSSPMAKKGIFIAILSAIAVIGIAAVVYFFVWPKFFGETTEEMAQVPIEETTPAPEIIPEPTPEDTTPVAEETAGQPTAPTAEQYVSILKTAADATAESPLTETSLTAIKSLTQWTTAGTASLKEYALKTAEGKLISISQLLTAFMPSIFNAEINANFDKGGMLSYTDEKGTWLILTAQLKDGATLGDVQNKVSALESSSELSNLFITDAGTATTWKSGQAEGVSTRYLSYSLAGAGVNYGWLNNKLIISGSYGAFKETVKRLK